MPKVIFCIPTTRKPHQKCLDSLAASIPLIIEAGWEEGLTNCIGNPYISRARETMLTKAMKANADVIVFIDHDVSWEPSDLLRLIDADGDVIAGTYRFKEDDERYMGGIIPDIQGRPQVRADGCIKASCVPAGFLKVTRNCINRFMLSYPQLMYLDEGTCTVDLFNHGAHKGIWWGEDYAFCRNWTDIGGEIWIMPNISVGHHTSDNDYPGNYHEFLLRQPGGSKSANPVPPPGWKVAA